MDARQGQQQNNLSTDLAWERYAPHRARVMRLVPEDQQGTLVWLGAGNGNDLDLSQLLSQFEAVTLVDIDEEAMGRALARQPAELRVRCKTQLCDTSGVLDQLVPWRAPEQVVGLESLASRTAAGALEDIGLHNVVVSSGVLSQIAWGCRQTLGPDHPALNEIASAAVDAHLQTIARLTAQGGVALVVVDSISNDKYPLAELCRATNPMAVLNQLSARGACYPTTHPEFVCQRLLASGALHKLARRGAWLWEVSDARTVLVYALILQSATA